MYILPPFRFTVYAIGIVLGYVLRMHKNTKLSKSQLNLGWFVTTTGVLGTLFITSLMSVYNYKFDILHAALFSSVAPIPWCFFFAWVIYTSQLGYKSEQKVAHESNLCIITHWSLQTSSSICSNGAGSKSPRSCLTAFIWFSSLCSISTLGKWDPRVISASLSLW